MLGLPSWALFAGLPLWLWAGLSVYYGNRTSGPAPGLSYVTGPMGAGKTYFLLREMVDALTRGRYVISNVKLAPNAFRRIARHNTMALLAHGGRANYVRWLESHYRYVTDIEDAIGHGLPCRCPTKFLGPDGLCMRSDGEHVPPKEGDGLIAWDEGADQLWNRDWNDPAVKEQRKRLVIVMRRLRKLGFACLLATQHKDSTEKQLRDIATWEIKIENRREIVRVLGARLLPMPLFVAGYHAAQRQGFSRPEYGKWYLLGWARKLYSTMDLTYVTHDERGRELVRLPRVGRRGVPEGARPAPPSKIRDQVLEGVRRG